MLPDKMEHCIVFMNSWDVSGVFWSFSKCNITIPHFPTGDSSPGRLSWCSSRPPDAYEHATRTAPSHAARCPSAIPYMIMILCDLLDAWGSCPRVERDTKSVRHQRSCTARDRQQIPHASQVSAVPSTRLLNDHSMILPDGSLCPTPLPVPL